MTEETHKRAAHRYHLQELKKQIDSNKERKNLETDERRGKQSVFWAGATDRYGRNSPNLKSGNSSLARSMNEIKRERQQEYKVALDNQNEELKKYRQGGNMT